MLVDDIGLSVTDVAVTNDGATILLQLEVEHPAARLLVDLAQLQDEEVGDGTTSVIIIAAELLKNADELVKQKLHPITIMNGYRIACKDGLYLYEGIIKNNKIAGVLEPALSKIKSLKFATEAVVF
ncbi:T-complex protein 1 subunit alpha-like [Lycorma delicatula]|uniref:T-complex protein 1 subunit alpha-like n=1 Tax=Lycorma delicatula TaxID=130591 RepID=UPI003F5143B1